MPTGFLSVMLAIQGVASVASGLSAAAVIRRLGFERTVAAGITLFAAGIPSIALAAITLRQQELPARVQGRGHLAMAPGPTSG